MRLFNLLFLLSLFFAKTAYADALYSGSLTSGDGLVGTKKWQTNAEFSWAVDFDPVTLIWTYDYSLTVKKKDISHIIIELSSTFGPDNIFAGTTNGYEIGTFGESQGASNPYIPSDIYGIKFEPTADTTHYEFTIVTDRSPMWGDFYAKGGKTSGVWNTIYNDGFDQIDLDPDITLYPSSMETVWYHILVPDTTSFGGFPLVSIPEPATMLLLCSALGMLGMRRRKK